MTTRQADKPVTATNTFLTPQEQAVCMAIADREVPHNLRAMALLALNDGSTQIEAAEKTGLTTGQIKYWKAKFQKQKLDIFPAALLEEFETNVDTEIAAEVETEVKTTAKKVDLPNKKAKKKDEKEKKAGKKNKKTKKGKKDKKGKKTKQSKKKNGKAKKARKNK